MENEDKRIKEAWDNLMDVQAEVAAEGFAKNLMECIENAGECAEYNERIPLIYMKIISKLQTRLEEMSGGVKVEDE